jgi:hypothetical protein
MYEWGANQVTGGLFLYKFAEFEFCSFKYKQILLKFKILSGGLGLHSVVPGSAHEDRFPWSLNYIFSYE